MRIHAGIFLAASLMATQGMAMADEKPAANRLPQPSGLAVDHQHHEHGVAQQPAGRGAPPGAPEQGKRQGRDWTKYPLITPVMRSGERCTTKRAVVRALHSVPKRTRAFTVAVPVRSIGVV